MYKIILESGVEISCRISTHDAARLAMKIQSRRYIADETDFYFETTQDSVIKYDSLFVDVRKVVAILYIRSVN